MARPLSSARWTSGTASAPKGRPDDMSGTKTCTGAKLRDDQARMEAFMRALGETASPVRAAAAAGVSTNVAYALRRDDMAFALEWDKAVDMAMENLIGESYRRAVEGV